MSEMTSEAAEDVVERPPPVSMPADKPRRPGATSAMRQMREQEDEELKAYLDGLSAQTAIKVQVRRIAPEKWKGKPCAGPVGSYEEPISEEEISEQHGGGTYTVVIQRPTGPNGSFQYFRRLTVKIPGPPKLETLGFDEDDSGSSGDIAKQAMSVMQQTMREERARAERIEREGGRNNGFDPRVLEVMNAPLLEQLRSLEAERRSLDDKITRLMTTKPDTSFQEKMLERMGDESGRRLDALREQHGSEIREIRETHKQDLSRVHDSYKDQLQSIERSHQREVDNMKLAYEGRIETMKAANETRIDGLKSEITRSDRDITKLEAECGTLRAKKDKSLPETLREVASIKEDFSEIFGDGEEEKKDWVDKILDNPLTQGIADRIVKGGSEQPQDPMQAAMAQVPPGQPFMIPGDQRIFMKGQDGQVRIMPRGPRKRRAGAAGQAPRKKAPPPPATPAAEVGLEADELKLAIGFIESAVQNNTSPEDFARSARTMVPVGIRVALREKGVDWFLNDLAKPADGSPLLTQRGRNFVREVARLLIEGDE